jgi:protein-L-isoaspartate(D-aspartate) O-methyltransferase
MRRAIALTLVGLLAAACTTTEPPTVEPTDVPPLTAPPSTLEPPTATESPPTVEDAELAEQRQDMVDGQIAGRGVADPVVLSAMEAGPRHRFVDDRYLEYAYGDMPLPIGQGQTISQPFIVGLMSEALEIEPGAKVLEIGTGSGYQAAVLAEMGMDVYSIEIIPELADRAQSVLTDLGYEVELRTADGYFGWPEEAPFDAIIVTAAPDHVPQPLVEQLDPGGVMVVPIGPMGVVQTLWRFTMTESGELDAESLATVSFVPLVSGE